MNNLFQHIEYLLSAHDCVIVPGLGAFIAILSPAKIDYDKGTILPPSRSVMFNQAVSSDDGLLANSYMRKYNISFEEARLTIIRQTALLREKLFTDKKIKIGNLGTLHLGEENNIVFTPGINIVALNKNLGYETLNFKEASIVSIIQFSSTDDETEPKTLQQESVEPIGNHRQSISIKLFSKIAAAIFSLIAISIAAIFYPIPSDKREQRASVVPVHTIMPIMIAMPTEEEELAEETPVRESDKINVNLHSHYLIVATFSNKKEALNYIALNSSEECPMQSVESRKVTRIAIASSDDKEQLRKLLNTKEVLQRYPNAWIWSRE